MCKFGLTIFIIIGLPAMVFGQSNETHKDIVKCVSEATPVQFPDKITDALNSYYNQKELSPTYIYESYAGDTTTICIYLSEVLGKCTKCYDATKKYWNCNNGLMIPVFVDDDFRRSPLDIKQGRVLLKEVQFNSNNQDYIK